MTIKPVLVPDHDAASLRKLMDHFAEAATGPTKRQLTESRAAVTAAQGVAEGLPHDVDHMPGATVKNPNSKCKRCHGHGTVYKTADGKVVPTNQPGAKRYKCGACSGIGIAEAAKQKTPGVALSKAYKKDFDGKKPGQGQPETALTGAYSATGKPGGALKKTSVSEGGSALVDMKGKKCTTCKKGTYQETGIQDNMHGELHCTKCNTVVKSRQPAASKKKRVSEGPDKGWVPNPDNPGYYIHRSDLPQTGKVSDPAKAKLGRIINKYFGQIYNYGDGDNSLDYLDKNAPSWNSLFDKHDGDIDAIIANEPADVLKQAALELKNVADDLKYELDESENLNEFLAPDGSNYGGGGGGDEPRQFRVIITLYDDSSAEDETAERKIGITVTATSEKAACDLATTMLLKSPRYDGSRITNVTARPVLDEQTMSRAAKGYEKYGREGMAALALAGREGRALDPVRDRYDRYDEAVAEGSAGAELKAIDGDYYEDSTDFFSMFEQDHFDREEESADGMEIRGYIDDVCVMVFKFSTPDMMGGWGNYDDSALIAESGVEDDEEEGETCPECDGAGCPECYGEEDRDRAHDHAQGMERESAGMAEGVLGDIGSEIGHGVKGLKRTIQGKPSRQAVKDKYRDRSAAAYKAGDRNDAKKNADRWERVHNTTNDGMLEAGQPDVMRHRGDTTVKVVKRAGKPIGEIGIDAEASPGNGQYYVKLYDGSYDAVGFDTAAEALAELRAAISEGITETADGVKYGVFATGGSVGSQRFRDDPLKTFDTKEEATADARRRRSALSPGERGYYRMGYVVKPIKGEVAEDDVDDFVARGGKITQVKPNKGPRRSGVSLGSRHIGTVRGGKASSISGKRANTRPTIKPVVAVEQQVDEKSEAIRHGNNSRSIYHVDESVDPIEQLRADIRRFAQ
jgi:hypothetical protein